MSRPVDSTERVDTVDAGIRGETLPVPALRRSPALKPQTRTDIERGWGEVTTSDGRSVPGDRPPSPERFYVVCGLLLAVLAVLIYVLSVGPCRDLVAAVLATVAACVGVGLATVGLVGALPVLAPVGRVLMAAGTPLFWLLSRVPARLLLPLLLALLVMVALLLPSTGGAC